jgi:hypothetical protein
MPNGNLKILKGKTGYEAWGDMANTAKSQGWYPETNYGDVTVYRSPHDHAFNDVVISPNPQDPLGHIALLGHDNNTFDVAIRDNKGNVVKMVNKGLSPAQVQDYITNSRSTVAQRNMSILKATPPIDIAAK